MVFFRPESQYFGKRLDLAVTRSQEDISGKLAGNDLDVIQREVHADLPEKNSSARWLFSQKSRADLIGSNYFAVLLSF